MTTISLCMIVRNEAVNLPGCLASVADLMDEVVILDTGSTDDTTAIAAEAGARIYSHVWQDDFAAARNAALAKVTQDWVLVLDADETLTPAGRQLIQSLRQSSIIQGHDLNRLLVITLLRHEIGAKQSPYTQVSRLFRHHPALQFTRPYHETIDDSAEALMAQHSQWQVAQLATVAINHTGYQADPIAVQAKFERAQRCLERQLTAHPDDTYTANKLGALYGQQGDWLKGVQLLQQALANAPEPPDAITRSELHYHLGLGYRQLGQFEAASEHYQRSFALPIPDLLKLEAHINLGSLLKGQNDLTAALKQFQTAAQIDPNSAIAHYNLGVTYRALGQLPAAVAAYETAIACDPTYADAHLNLGSALFKLGRLSASKAAFEQAIQLYQQTEPAAAQRLRQKLQGLGLRLD